MALYSQLYGLTGGYASSGSYSLEVFTRGEDGRAAKRLGEHFFVVGPARYQRSFNYKISAKVTYEGASVNDFGEGIHNIQLSGIIGAYHNGPVRSPSVIREKLFGRDSGTINASDFIQTVGRSLAQELTEQAGFSNKPGYFDFFDLVWLLHDARHQDRFEQRKPERLISADPNSIGADGIYRAAAASGIQNLDSANSVLVFNDYDLSRRYEVIYNTNAFEFSQSVEDPFAWQWNLNLVAVDELSGRRPIIRQPIPDLGSVIPNLISALDDLNFTVTSAFRQINQAVSIIGDLQSAKDELRLSLEGFAEDLDVQSIDFWQSLQSTRDTNQTLRSWLEAYYFPGDPIETLQTALPQDNTDYSTDITRVRSEALEKILAELQAGLSVNQSQMPNYIQVPPGVDTWEDLALQLSGDVTQASAIALLNRPGTSPRDLQRVRIPEQGEQPQTGIIAQTVNENQDQLQRNLFGTDLALSQSGDISASPNGDLETVNGLDSLTQNLLDRLNHVQGTIPLHPQWGTSLIAGSLPDEIIARAGPAKILENIYQDLGVRSVDVTDFSLSQDRLDILLSVVPQGDASSFELAAQVVI